MNSSAMWKIATNLDQISISRIRLLIFIVTLLLSGCGEGNEHTQPSTGNTSEQTLASPEVTPLSDKEQKCTSEVKQQGRNEPEYTGMQGYLMETSLIDEDKNLPTYPWNVATLKQVGPELWEESNETLPAKTPVTVLEQHLKHEGFGRYSGYLVIQVVGDSKEYALSPYNFAPTDWWNCPPHLAVKYSNVIARVKDGVQPIDEDRKWQEMGELKEVLCRSIPGIENRDLAENPVECLVYKEYRYGYGGVEHIFSSANLEIVY